LALVAQVRQQAKDQMVLILFSRRLPHRVVVVVGIILGPLMD